MEYGSKMMQLFRSVIQVDKSEIHSRLGEPQIRFPSLWVYHRNGLWLVLGFQEENSGGKSVSQVFSLTAFDEQLTLLWSRGIRLVRADRTSHSTLDAFLDANGAPHGSLLSGGNLFYYLTENGCIVYVSPKADESIEVSNVTLTDLAARISSQH